MAVAVASGLAPGVAVSKTVGTIETPGVAEKPKLAGESTLWAQERVDGSLELWSGEPGARTDRIQRFAFDPIGSYGRLEGDLAASPSLAFLTTYALDSAEGRGLSVSFSDHYVGPTGAQPEWLTRCGSHGRIRSGDVWGEAYAYRQCDDTYGHVEVRDEAAMPLSPPRAVGVGGFGVRIAGRFVAWLDGRYSRFGDPYAAVVVYDRVADTEVYRLPADLGAIQSFDIEEDGKVAVAFDPRGEGDDVVGWASPAEPWVHPLPLRPRALYDVRIVGDRIAFQTGNTVSAGWVREADVGVVDLGGNVSWLAGGTDAFLMDESFDYDGKRLLWRELSCEERRLVIRDVDASGKARRPATRCPLRMLRPATVRRGVARFHFDCGAYKPPCGFRTELHIAGRGGGRASKTVESGNPVRARLTQRARRLLRKHSSLKVRATVRLTDADLRVQVRRRTIRLRTR